MTHEADCPIDRAPEARGGADGDVVEVGLALPPTALHALSLSRLLMCRSRRHLMEVEGGQRGGSGAEVGGRKRGGAGGVRGMSDRCGALDVALRA